MGDKVKALDDVDPRQLSEWEKRFLRSLAGRGFGSERQEAWVDTIYLKHFPDVKP
jgi:hypothetical protein